MFIQEILLYYKSKGIFVYAVEKKKDKDVFDIKHV